MRPRVLYAPAAESSPERKAFQVFWILRRNAIWVWKGGRSAPFRKNYEQEWDEKPPRDGRGRSHHLCQVAMNSVTPTSYSTVNLRLLCLICSFSHIPPKLESKIEGFCPVVIIKLVNSIAFQEGSFMITPAKHVNYEQSTLCSFVTEDD